MTEKFKDDVMSSPSNDAFYFVAGPTNKELLRITADGKFFIEGKLVANDLEVYLAFRHFLADHGYLSKKRIA